MALAILFQKDDSVVILDAVQRYGKTRTSKLSSHPIDKSAVITDHISKENPKFEFKGIVSSADFHSPSVTDPELYSKVTDPPEDTELAIFNESGGSLSDLLPSSVAGIFEGNEVEVTTDDFRGYNHIEARNRLNDAWDQSELVTLLDYDYDFSTGRSVDVKEVEDCVITRFEDVEEIETGDSLSANFTIEKIRYAYLKDTQIEGDPEDPDTDDDASSEDQDGGSLDQEGSVDKWWEGSSVQQGIDSVTDIIGGAFK